MAALVGGLRLRLYPPYEFCEEAGRDRKKVVPETEITHEMVEVGVDALEAWKGSSGLEPKGAATAIYRWMKSLEPLKKAR